MNVVNVGVAFGVWKVFGQHLLAERVDLDLEANVVSGGGEGVIYSAYARK